MRVRWTLLLLLPCLGGATPLTVQQAVEIALTNSPELLVTEYQLAEDRAAVDSAVRLRNPEFRGSAASSELFFPLIDGTSYVEPLRNVNADIRWSPPNLGSWQARKATAERRVDQTLATRQQKRRNLIARVRTLHARLINYNQEIALASTAVELRGQLRQLAVQRLQQQVATGLDQSLSELDYLDAVAELEELQSDRREAYHNLLMLLGVSQDGFAQDGQHQQYELVEQGQFECRSTTQSMKSLMQSAAQHNPDLEVHRARVAEVETDITRAYLEIIPWLDFVQVGAEMGRGDTRFEFNGDSNDYASLRLRFGITLPVLDWNQSEIEGLKARKARLQAEYQADMKRLENRVRRLASELDNRVALYERYKTSDSTVVDQSLQQIRRALEVGETDLVQMALVQSRTLRARRARLRSFYRCQETAIELERLVLGAFANQSGQGQPVQEPSSNREQKRPDPASPVEVKAATSQPSG